jgi:lipopolysaccharide biosynthesis glycosyltransferase
MNHSKNLVVTLGNKPYLDQVKQLFSSLYFNAEWKGDCMLLCDRSLNAEDTDWFNKRGIRVRPYDPLLPEKIGISHQIAWLKLNIFTPAFREWENIIFLDGDIIVRAPLDELLNLDGLNAVRVMNGERSDLMGQFHNYDENRLKMLTSQFDCPGPALNAGVLAFKSTLIKDDMLENFKKIAYEYKDVIFISEETVLNMYFHKKWNELPAVFNICPNWEIGLRGCKPEDLKGRVLHCYSTLFFRQRNRKFWSPGNPLFPEWKANLDKSDEVDFSDAAKTSRKTSPHRLGNAAQEGKYLLSMRQKHFIRYHFAQTVKAAKLRLRPLVNGLLRLGKQT